MVHLRIAHYGFAQNNSEENDLNTKRNPGSSNRTKHKINSALLMKTTFQSTAATPLSDKKQWECDICSKTFTTKYFLKKHKRLHTGR